ncbi:MAG: hypothetical protein ACC742_08405 [Thermoanaerobaculales bacterium]
MGFSMLDSGACAGMARCTPAQAASTFEYLDRFVRFDTDLKLRVSAVFSRCCLATHPDFGLEPAAAAAEAATLAQAVLDHPDRDGLDLDPLLLVTCYALLADEGVEVSRVSDLVTEIARRLGTLGADVRLVGRIRHITSLLAARGFEASIDAPAKEMLQLTREPGKLLNASGEVVADFADHLFADQTALDEDLTVMLALISLGELRNYRVDLGAKLLRLCVAQGRPCEEAGEGLNFVALQRRRSGAYGFLNPFLPAEERNENLDEAFFLPMTLNAVWLLRIEAASRSRSLGSTEGHGS